MNRTESLGLVVVGCILCLVLAAGGVMLKFYDAQADAKEGAAIFDGIETSGNGASVLIKEGTIWNGCPKFFSEPFETVVFIFRNGHWISFTTQHDVIIDCPVSFMVTTIQKSGRTTLDVFFCVHNHFAPVGFTPGDKGAYHYLRGKGFRGVFGIYYTATGRFREMEER